MRRRKRELSDHALQLIANRFRLLSEPTRLKILHALGDAEKNVTEIVAETGASQANVSKHLGAMLDAAIVSRRKQGLTANYRVVDPTIFELCDVVCSRLKDELQERQKLLRAI
jgi:DNA-binding transcriptional ArsR family regulator